MDDEQDDPPPPRGCFAFDEVTRRAGGFPQGFAVPLLTGASPATRTLLDQLLRLLNDDTELYRTGSEELLSRGRRRH